MSFGKNEKTSGGGFVQRNAYKNESTGCEFFIQGDEFGKLLGAGWAPCGPQIEEKELAVNGGGVEGLA